ncbi:MAG: fumarylacetoacetate hydrolase family protein [Parvibaculum sp.]|nr:fumarylacetoacetate hydrolase family protein [Parvibaculum sp.]
MKIRRICDANSPQGSRLEIVEGAANAVVPDWLQELAPTTPFDGGAILPFQPRSFRDCMLFEQHWIQASRGFARRFMPGAFRVTQLYEHIMQSPFPAFRPPALWKHQPIYYFSNHLTIIPGDTLVKYPSHTKAFDYELELGIVLAKPLFNATPDEALDAIGGFVVLNDFSARDIQRPEMQSGFGPQKCKHFITSISQTLTTADEVLPRINTLVATVHLNGELIVKTSTAGMRHSLGNLLAFLSNAEQLYPGELIGTGTLPSGSGIETGRLLERGDTLRLAIEGVGELSHTII